MPEELIEHAVIAHTEDKAQAVATAFILHRQGYANAGGFETTEQAMNAACITVVPGVVPGAPTTATEAEQGLTMELHLEPEAAITAQRTQQQLQ
eukprot:182339-Chlamydomonas_euryale.AAC.1